MNTPPVPRRPRTRPTPRSQHKTTPTVDPRVQSQTDAQQPDPFGRFIIVGSLCMLFLFCVLQITNAPTWGYAVFLPLGLVVITAAGRRGIAHAKQ